MPPGKLVLLLNYSRASKLLREVAQVSGRVYFSPHARKRMSQRGITDTQVLRCLRQGRFVEGPARSVKGNWQATMEHVSAGDVIRVVAAIDHDGQGGFIVVITVYWT